MLLAVPINLWSINFLAIFAYMIYILKKNELIFNRYELIFLSTKLVIFRFITKNKSNFYSQYYDLQVTIVN